MERDQEITKVVAEMVEWCKKFLQLSELEKTGFMLLQSQINSLEVKQRKLMEENQTIEQQNAGARDISKKIVETANEEARRVMDHINDKNFRTIKLLQEVDAHLAKVKQFCTDVEMRKYRELDQAGPELKKKAAVK